MPGNAPAAAAATLSRALCARRVLDMGSTTLRHSWFLSLQHLMCAACRFRSADDIVPRALTSRLDSVGALTRGAPRARRMLDMGFDHGTLLAAPSLQQLICRGLQIPVGRRRSLARSPRGVLESV